MKQNGILLSELSEVSVLLDERCILDGSTLKVFVVGTWMGCANLGHELHVFWLVMLSI